MELFKNADSSHQHSLETLKVLYGYDSFLDSLEFIADFGCGQGLDTQWWATLETRDEPPEPRNYKVYAVDKNINQFDQSIGNLPNVHTFDYDLDNEYFVLPRPVDLVWCHDTFQYLINPVNALKTWNNSMNVDAMLILVLPQNQHYYYNRLQSHSYNNVYFNYNIVNLMYMLAVNGFDCRDAYFYKEENNPWLHAAVYKSNIAPMDPTTTNWYHLAELDLLNDSVVACLNKYGCVKQEEIVTAWLDKDFHYSKE
jgi:hypothetical protein